ncbi:MAG: hypothetical protein JNM57_13280 [Cyclobacteriaceae bacterium]|nr:hypothetical protein [Cyclobacteriaceae bacterium]
MLAEMGEIRKIQYHHHSILEIDYSGASEEEMMALISQAAQTGMTENNKVLVLATHRNNYITPKFINHAKTVTKDVVHLIDKMALVGLTPPQKWILKGYSIFFQRNFKAFDTRESALLYLTSEHTTDNDLPDYYKKK